MFGINYRGLILSTGAVETRGTNPRGATVE